MDLLSQHDDDLMPPSWWRNALLPWLIHWRKELGVAIAIALVLAGPFLLRPAQSTAPSHYDRRLVILSPHNESIRREFGRAFAKHRRETTGERLYIDWRSPGGTSEIAMVLKSEYTAVFEYYWHRAMDKSWSPEIASAFLSNRTKVPTEAGTELTPEQEARKAFLLSNVGIGIDLFFGGGAFDFQQQADAGVLMARDRDKPGTGPAALSQKHPDWFSDESIPEGMSGEPYRDPELRWVGAALSSFGIVYNRDVLRRLGVAKDPTQWSDLANPALYGQVALSDPTKSGSVTRAFEMIIQQQMQEQLERLTANPGKLRNDKEIEAEAVRRGWAEGFKLIQRITANARYFTDSATKIPLEVSRGDAAAGMSIDFFGKSAEDAVRGPEDVSRVGFVAPVGGTSIGADPIGMLRGAPDPELATDFIEFVLSDAGQKIWSYAAGAPGGPERTSLRRLPIRKDFYSAQNFPHMTDPKDRPYELADSFSYHPEWTGPAFNAIRFLIRVMCVDAHEEQRKAWREMIEAGFPARATAVFEDVKLISYDSTINSINKVLRTRNKVQEVRKARELGDMFRANYEKAHRLAAQGR